MFSCSHLAFIFLLIVSVHTSGNNISEIPPRNKDLSHDLEQWFNQWFDKNSVVKFVNNPFEPVIKTFDSYYNMAMKTVNRADNIFESIDEFMSPNKSNRKPGLGFIQNINNIFKSVTSFFDSSGKDDEDESILDKLTSMFEYVNNLMRSFNGRSLLNKYNTAYIKFQSNSDILINFQSRNSSTSRQIKLQSTKLLQMLLVPALVMTGVMPYILPPLKMGVMMVGSLTNMAFVAALVSLIRGIIFDPDPSRRVVYPNYGYKTSKHKMPPFYVKDEYM